MLEQPFWFFANYGDYERGLSSLMVGCAMLGMGATLTWRDFLNIVVNWKGLAVGMLAQLVLVPVWAALVMVFIEVVPSGFGGLTIAGSVGIATGIALMAAMPGGSASNLFAFLGNGNLALSVSLTTLTTFFCLVTTPVVLGLLISVHIPGDYQIDSLRIVVDIGLFLLVPLIAGMLVREILPDWSLPFSKIMVRASLLVLALIIVGSLGAGRLDFAPYGWLGPVIVIVFCLVIQQIGQLSAVAFRLPARDCFAVMAEVTIKNSLLGLLLLTSMFPGDLTADQAGPEAEIIAAARDGCVFVVLFYGGVALVAGAVSVIQRRNDGAAQD